MGINHSWILYIVQLSNNMNCFPLAQPDKSFQPFEHTSTNGELPEMDDDDYHDLNAEIYGDIEEEDPYNPCCPDQIYDTVEPQSSSEIINRPPAPIPRPSNLPEPEENTTYISKGANQKFIRQTQLNHSANIEALILASKIRNSCIIYSLLYHSKSV